jgi:anti-anti-sigma factor
MEPLQISSGDVPGSLRLSGELDISNVEHVKGELQRVFRETGRLALDTSDMTFMDSQGLRMLIHLGDQAAAEGTTIQVTNCSPQVQRVLDLSVPKGIPGVEIIRTERQG